MHQIAKINHCETSILGGNGIAVKLAALLSVGAILSSLQKINEVFPRKSCFPEQGHERTLRNITVVLGNHGSPF
jgi:hypothetical protein